MAKTLYGIVSSDRGDKTIVVTVATRMTHPIYKKQYTVNHKFMAHDEQNQAKMGDKVSIVETRPISARKRFKLLEVTNRAAIRHEEPEAPVTSHKSLVKDKEAKTSDKRQETKSPEEDS